MNTNHKIISSALAALAAGSAMIAAPTAVGAHSPQRGTSVPQPTPSQLARSIGVRTRSGSDDSESHTETSRRLTALQRRPAAATPRELTALQRRPAQRELPRGPRPVQVRRPAARRLPGPANGPHSRRPPANVQAADRPPARPAAAQCRPPRDFRRLTGPPSPPPSSDFPGG